MKIEQVRKLSTEQRLLYWVKERQNIKMLKDLRTPPPWTDDKILQTYRFCNVRRMDDKVSQWLLKNWYQPYKNHPNMLVAATLARQLNNTEALEDIGFPTKWDPASVLSILEDRAARGHKNYSAAYMITGTLGGSKPVQTVYRVADTVYQAGIVVTGISLEALASSLHPLPGFSTFIAGQVVADLRWAVSGRWRDRRIWASYGPGSLRGMNRLKGRRLENPLARTNWSSEFRIYLEWFYEAVNRTDLEAIDAQNCLCEWDKYERVLNGEGRPKQLYRSQSNV